MANCKRCGGNLMADSEGDVPTCLQYGHEQMNIRQRHEYFEENRADILHDVDTLGKVATYKKWQLSRPAISGLLKRWTGDSKGREITPDEAPRSRRTGWTGAEEQRDVRVTSLGSIRQTT